MSLTQFLVQYFIITIYLNKNLKVNFSLFSSIIFLLIKKHEHAKFLVNQIVLHMFLVQICMRHRDHKQKSLLG